MEKPSDRYVLLNCPEMSDVAANILSEKPNHFARGDIQWLRFPDGTPRLQLKDVDMVRGKDVIFLASLRDTTQLLDQISLIYSLPRYLVKSLIVVLPFFPTGTMERVEHEGDIATAMTLARILSAIPLTQKGPTKLMIYDIHTLQNRFYFQDNIIPLLVSAIPVLVEELKQNLKDIVVTFPDEGAQKRFGSLFKDYEQIICHKVREDGKRIITIKEGEPKGKHCLIVDDLVQTGGTLVECKEALEHRGATDVSAFVTHAVFPAESWKKFLVKDKKQEGGKKGFAHFIITDSCPALAKQLDGQAPFKVLKLGKNIADNILKYEIF